MSDLKITNIEAIPLSYRYTEDEIWECPGWVKLQRNTVLVRIWTDKGIQGIGEIGESSSIPQSVVSIVEEQFKKLLIGEDPFDIEKIWKKLYTRSRGWGQGGLAVQIISGLEIALWDIIGKSLKKPVYELLGGICRDKIRIYASAGMSSTLDELIAEMQGYKDEGYTAMKMRIGADIEGDIEVVSAARKALGKEVDLMVDAGMCYVDRPWDFNTAYRVAKKLEKVELLWLEEPFVAENIDDYARLSQLTDIPIAAGENHQTKYGFKELMVRQAVDIIQPDATRSGGILESKKIMAMADAFNLQCAPHIFTSGVSLMANLHLIVSTPNVLIMEYDRTVNPLRDGLLIEPLKYENGYVYLPEVKAGLGVNITDEILEKFRFIPGEVNKKPAFSLDQENLR